MADSSVSVDKVRQQMRGVPEATVQACADYLNGGGEEAFNRAVCGVLEHHLPRKPEQSVVTMPGSTVLVAELQLDSLAMVEMVFIFEDVFGVKLEQERLVKVVTLDDLRALLREEFAKRPIIPA